MLPNLYALSHASAAAPTSVTAAEQAIGISDIARKIFDYLNADEDPRSVCAEAIKWCNFTTGNRRMCEENPSIWKELEVIVFGQPASEMIERLLDATPTPQPWHPFYYLCHFYRSALKLANEADEPVLRAFHRCVVEDKHDDPWSKTWGEFVSDSEAAVQAEFSEQPFDVPFDSLASSTVDLWYEWFEEIIDEAFLRRLERTPLAQSSADP